MRFLIRTGIFVLQLAVFFVLVTLLSYLTTYLTAERYSAGNTPSSLFPVVAIAPDARPGAALQYELLRWRQLTRKDLPPLSWNLRLLELKNELKNELKGEFVVPTQGGFEPHVRFSATTTTDGWQRVDVKVTDDDYVVYAVYVTDGAKVVPESFRIWGPTSALVALFPAFVLTVVMSRLFRRWRERKKAVPAAIS
jgi:hypothetical protein